MKKLCLLLIGLVGQLLPLVSIGSEKLPPTPPFAYVKNGKICHESSRFRIESCREPNSQGEVELVKQRRAEFEAKVRDRIAENESKQKPNLKSCSPYFSQHYHEHLDEALRGGVEVWGFAGYGSAQDYAKARARLYVSLLRSRNVCQ